MYWVYVYTKNNGYNFTTTETITAAKIALLDMMKEFNVSKGSPNLDMAAIFYGNVDGPLSGVDPVQSMYGR